mmetsp:Transcript_32156/g.28501  ORF Transcript_32156/g.28501 Transcript_32156/m.28501 type:complete len:268 (-) Transcript_32156:8-811(-)
MHFLQICAIRLSNKSWETLSQSISQNQTIKILGLNAVGLNHNVFKYLAPCLDSNSTLEILDLSYNFMGDEMGSYIAKVISNQSERRDNVVWLAGLRGETPSNEEYKSGLQSLILRYNDLGDYTCSELSRVLLYDVYIKSIDFRNNDISDKGIKDMCNFLKSNKTVLNCDLRLNPGSKLKLLRNLMLKLLRNLNVAKKNPRIDEKRWMNPELLTIEVPRYMASKVQKKINKLYEDHDNIVVGHQRSLSNSMNYDSSNLQTKSTPVKKE